MSGMSKTKIIIGIFVLSLIFIMFQLPWPVKTERNHPIIERIDSLNREGEIIFLSDTQEPIWVETILLDENSNLIARDQIFSEIISQKPAKVVHLGDIVALGYYDEDWRPIDNYLKKLLEENIEFYPTLGNHELMFFSEMGEKNFLERFPFYSKIGYSVNNGTTEVIILNSNFSKMTTREIVEQQEWYINKLIELEQDSTINAVVVGCHHSPFTNSKIVDPDEKVEQLFVPPFIEFQKCKLFLSGHCHSFEHFKYKGKDFLVLGGGGGLQQPLYVGSEAKWEDQYDRESPIRMFHFLKYKIENDTLKVNLNILDENFSHFNDEYKINITL